MSDRQNSKVTVGCVIYGSYRTAWMLCHKQRRAMVDPERSLLSGWVVIKEMPIA